MIWIWCLIIALIIIVFGLCSLVFYRRNPRLKKALSKTKILICTVFVSSAVLFFAVYKETIFNESQFPVLKSIIMAVHNTIRLFVVDGDFAFMADVKECTGPVVFSILEVLFGIELATAPFLTFSFVLSFFKDLQNNVKLFFTKEIDTYVFSELNERSILLAESIYEKKKAENDKALIIFADCFEKDDEESYEIQERVDVIDALCFKSDVTSLNLTRFGDDHELVFFLLSDEYQESIEQFITINNKYIDKENCSLYYFSTNIDSEVVNQKLDKDGGVNRKLRVRRVSETEQIVFDFLNNKGVNLFEAAKKTDNHVSVIVNGLGEYGTLMTKSLVWYLIMHGYTYEINCFDKDPKAEDKLRLLMPEVFLCAEGKNPHDQSYTYNIKVHSGIDLESYEYERLISEIKDPTFVFTSLGSDTRNVEVASLVKRILDRRYFVEDRSYISDNCYYATVIKNEIESKALGDVLGENNIFIGDNKTVFSYDEVVQNATERSGLERHLYYYGYSKKEIKTIADLYYSPIFDSNVIYKTAYEIMVRKDKDPEIFMDREKTIKYKRETDSSYEVLFGEYKKNMALYMNDNEAVKKAPHDIQLLHGEIIGIRQAISKFFGNEYNYKSSIASAIHINTRIKLKVSGAELPRDKRTPEQTDILCRTEHFRWSAYIRSVGFVYAPKKNVPLKVHNDLVPFDELTDKDAKKDDV